MGDRLGIRDVVDIFVGSLPASVKQMQKYAPGEARTHGLQIMRLTRCLLRYGGTSDALSKAINLRKLLQRWSDQKSMSEGGFEPPPS